MTRRIWALITGVLVAAVFLEAIFAGALLSGEPWARDAHKLNAFFLIGSSVLAGVAAVAILRRVPQGTRLGLTLLALAAVLILQTAAGALSAKGANLLWVHVPLGVALVSIAVRAAAGARRLGVG